MPQALPQKSLIRDLQRGSASFKSVAIVLSGLVLGWLILTAALSRKIERQSQVDEAQPADVIVVFGAAEYAGKPSPTFRARLDHAAALLKRGTAPILITSGGGGRDPRFTEGQVGRDYLISLGIPENKLIAETQSGDTSESAQRVAAIMRENRMHSCVAVSDGYHIFRVKKMMQAQGVTVYGSPRPDLRGASMAQCFEEAFKYTIWKLHLE